MKKCKTYLKKHTSKFSPNYNFAFLKFVSDAYFTALHSIDYCVNVQVLFILKNKNIWLVQNQCLFQQQQKSPEQLLFLQILQPTQL